MLRLVLQDFQQVADRLRIIHPDQRIDRLRLHDHVGVAQKSAQRTDRHRHAEARDAVERVLAHALVRIGQEAQQRVAHRFARKTRDRHGDMQPPFPFGALQEPDQRRHHGLVGDPVDQRKHGGLVVLARDFQEPQHRFGGHRLLVAGQQVRDIDDRAALRHVQLEEPVRIDMLGAGERALGAIRHLGIVVEQAQFHDHGQRGVGHEFAQELDQRVGLVVRQRVDELRHRARPDVAQARDRVIEFGNGARGGGNGADRPLDLKCIEYTHCGSRPGCSRDPPG